MIELELKKEYKNNEVQDLTENIISHIDNILYFLPPKKLVYFALDGALPMGMINYMRRKNVFN